MFKKHNIYSSKQIQKHFGGNIQSSMPLKNGKVLYCKFDPKPHEAWIEIGPLRKKGAEYLIKSKEKTHVFKKNDTNQWEFIGKATITDGTSNSKLRLINNSPPRNQVQIILKLKF